MGSLHTAEDAHCFPHVPIMLHLPPPPLHSHCSQAPLPSLAHTQLFLQAARAQSRTAPAVLASPHPILLSPTQMLLKTKPTKDTQISLLSEKAAKVCVEFEEYATLLV